MFSSRTRALLSFAATVAALWLLPVAARAGGATVPIAMQAAIFSKVLKYDQTLEQRGGDHRVVVATNGNDAEEARKLVQALESLKLDVSVVDSTGLAAKLRGASAVYVFPNAWSPRLSALCNEHKVLSLSGVEQDATNGRVSVALAVVDDKPRIIVHLPKSKAEGHHLSSRLLKLAEVIR